jgi:hypothetical protein
MVVGLLKLLVITGNPERVNCIGFDVVRVPHALPTFTVYEAASAAEKLLMIY